uniref:poly(ADP-ribose) glycohydrolase n=1 Tax=Latimeria chalumnae TaxID=7897 RepID=H3BAA5_LATCH
MKTNHSPTGKRKGRKEEAAFESQSCPKYGTVAHLGEDLKNLRRNFMHSCPPLPVPQPDHTILVEVESVKADQMPMPFQGRETDTWNRFHVKMPYSSHNSYEKYSSKGEKNKKEVPRWEIIRKALEKKKFKNAQNIEETIKSYNKKYKTQWDFSALQVFVEQQTQGEQQVLLEYLLPKMAELALQLPRLCPKPIPLLRQTMSHAITLSQQQIACLLANAFFCTFPHRNATEDKSEYANYPSINFSRLFEKKSERKLEKLKTVFCYFSQVTEDMPKGLVTFQRRQLLSPVNWENSTTKLSKLHVTSHGTIEKEGSGMLQVDFACAMVGGGVLSSGLIQEEIRFLINTELIVARLFTEKLNDEECLLITGAQQYSRYSGYGDTYRHEGVYRDDTPRDRWQRRCTEIVAIDALKFRNSKDQFKKNRLVRELNKAYCGFTRPEIPPQHTSAVATGNWGCGAFNGDYQFKALIQILAASEAGRDVAYFTFGNSQIMWQVYEMHSLLTKKNTTVGNLYSLLQKYCDEVWNNSYAKDIIDYIMKKKHKL